MSKNLWLGHVYLLAMNSKTWAGLAQGNKNAIQRAAETAYRTLGQLMDRSFDTMVKDLSTEGATIRLLEDNEVTAFETAVRYQQVQAAWVKAQEEKGIREAGPTMAKVRAVITAAMK